MKNEIIKITKDLEQGTITDNEARTLLLGLLGVSGCFECVVLYRKMQGDKELYQSYHRGKTKDEALRDFFNTIGEKGINVLWLNNC